MVCRITELCTSIEEEPARHLITILCHHLVRSGCVETGQVSQHLRNSQVCIVSMASKVAITVCQVVWFWRYAVSLVEHSIKTEVAHTRLDMRNLGMSAGIQQESVLHHLVSSLPWSHSVTHRYSRGHGW